MQLEGGAGELAGVVPHPGGPPEDVQGVPAGGERLARADRPVHARSRRSRRATSPTRAEDWIVRRLGEPVTNEYWHRVLHPHATGSSLDSFRMMQCVFPTGPTTCRYRCIFFTLRGRRRNPLAWVLYQAAAVGRDARSPEEGVRGRRVDLRRACSGGWRPARTPG